MVGFDRNGNDQRKQKKSPPPPLFFLSLLPVVHLRHVGRQVRKLGELDEVAHRDGGWRQRVEPRGGREPARRGARQARRLFGGARGRRRRGGGGGGWRKEGGRGRRAAAPFNCAAPAVRGRTLSSPCPRHATHATHTHTRARACVGVDDDGDRCFVSSSHAPSAAARRGARRAGGAGGALRTLGAVRRGGRI